MAIYFRHYCECGATLRPVSRRGQYWEHADGTAGLDPTHTPRPGIIERRAEADRESTLIAVAR